MLEQYINHMKWTNAMLCIIALLQIIIGTFLYALFYQVQSLAAESGAMATVCSQFISSGEVTIELKDKREQP